MKTVRETSGSLKFTLLIAALVLISRASCFAQGRALDAVLSGEITSSSMGSRPSRTVARRPNSALEIAFRTAETLHSGRLNAKGFADSLSLPPMPALSVAAAAALPVRPPQVGGSVPVGIRFPLPPGITYAPHQRLAVSHPDWGKAQSLRSKVEASDISPEDKAKLLAPWAWLEMREAELMERLEAIDASWSSIQHRVEAVINRYAEEYWRLFEIDAELTREFAAYEVYCSRQVPPEQVAAAGGSVRRFTRA